VSLNAEAFAWRQVEAHGNLLDVLVGEIVEVRVAWEPSIARQLIAKQSMRGAWCGRSLPGRVLHGKIPRRGILNASLLPRIARQAIA